MLELVGNVALLSLLVKATYLAAILLTADQILLAWLSETDLMLTSFATSTYTPHTKNEITNVITFHINLESMSHDKRTSHTPWNTFRFFNGLSKPFIVTTVLIL